MGGSDEEKHPVFPAQPEIAQARHWVLGDRRRYLGGVIASPPLQIQIAQKRGETATAGTGIYNLDSSPLTDGKLVDNWI